MPDFWRHSGFHLTHPHSSGGLVAGDDLLRAYFARPEIAPLDGSCAAERELFLSLQDDPRRAVSATELARLKDADARENYDVVLAFRERLLAAETLESAYRSLFIDARGEPTDLASMRVPPLFIDQLTQMILRNILAECDDGMMLRAAELFFRQQRAHVGSGSVVLADLETVESRIRASRDGSAFGNLGRLIAQAQTPLLSIDLDVLGADNAASYWSRDELHDTAIQMHYGSPGHAALCRVLGLWIAHFYDIEVEVEPIRQVDSAALRWYVGLDAGSTRLLNELYNGRAPDEVARGRVICMMALRLPDRSTVLRAARGLPCYLALAMNENDEVRMKPQNVLVNLPCEPRA